MNAPLARLLDLDGAWPADVLGREAYVDCREWGARLRYCAPASVVERFWAETASRVTAYTLFGSGDFHHLSALWLRPWQHPFTLLAFDNHPDWDTRPPAWCCGTWLNRAFKLPHLQRVEVWGCGNFELNPPHRWFGNQRAVASGRLSLNPWRERLGASAQRRFSGMVAADWRTRFQEAAARLAGADVYVTLDMDCLRDDEAVTDWEQGLFRVADLVWALGVLRDACRVIGGDLCGASSPAAYVRWTQRVNARLDHPKKAAPASAEAQATNLRALRALWPALTGTA